MSDYVVGEVPIPTSEHLNGFWYVELNWSDMQAFCKGATGSTTKKLCSWYRHTAAFAAVNAPLATTATQQASSVLPLQDKKAAKPTQGPSPTTDAAPSPEKTGPGSQGFDLEGVVNETGATPTRWFSFS